MNDKLQLTKFSVSDSKMYFTSLSLSNCECYPHFSYFSFSHSRCVPTIAQTTQQLRMMFFQGFYHRKNHLNRSCLSLFMRLSNCGDFITQIFVLILASLANINCYLPLNIYWNISYILKKLSLYLGS